MNRQAIAALKRTAQEIFLADAGIDQHDADQRAIGRNQAIDAVLAQIDGERYSVAGAPDVIYVNPDKLTPYYEQAHKNWVKYVRADTLTAAPEPISSPAENGQPSFVLVPREPTEAMIEAGYDALEPSSDLEFEEDIGVTKSYKAMLAAAPSPPHENNSETKLVLLDRDPLHDETSTEDCPCCGYSGLWSPEKWDVLEDLSPAIQKKDQP